MPDPIDRHHELMTQIEVVQQSLNQLKEAIAAIDSAKEPETVWFSASPEGRAGLLREYGRTFKERVSALASEIDSWIKAICEDAQSLKP